MCCFVMSVAAFKTSLALVQRSSTGCVCIVVCEIETLTMRRPRLKMAYCATAKKVLFSPKRMRSHSFYDRDLYKYLMLLFVELCYAVWYLVR